MRIAFATTGHADNVAKSLKTALSESGVTLGLTKARDAVAAMLGYRNWAELKARCAPGTAPSILDEGVDEATATERRAYQARMLAKATGMAADAASRVVEALRPSASRGSAQAAREPARPPLVEPPAGWPAWRRMMVAPGIGDLLYGRAPGDSWIADQGFWDEPRTSRIPMPGDGVLTVATGRNGDDRYVVVDRIAAVLHDAGGRAVAFLGADVVDPRMLEDVFDPSDDAGFGEALFLSLDDSDSPGPELATAMEGTGDLDALFRQGGACLHIGAMVRDPVATAPGTGRRMLQAAIDAYAGKWRGRARIASVAYDASPLQFSQDGRTRRTAAYREATRSLRAGMEAMVAGLRLGGRLVEGTAAPNAVALSFEREKADRDLVDYPEARKASKEDGFRWPRWVTDSVGLDVERTPGPRPSRAGDGRAPRPSTPHPLTLLDPHEFPAGFDVTEAALHRSLSPHPDLWSHLPRELTSIEVRPRGCWEALGGGHWRRALIYDLSFGGSHLRIWSDETTFGSNARTLPAEYRIIGLPLENRFVEGMTCHRLQQVLGAHLHMLFDGRAGTADGPIAKTRLERPAKPAAVPAAAAGDTRLAGFLERHGARYGRGRRGADASGLAASLARRAATVDWTRRDARVDGVDVVLATLPTPDLEGLTALLRADGLEPACASASSATVAFDEVTARFAVDPRAEDGRVSVAAVGPGRTAWRDPMEKVSAAPSTWMRGGDGTMATLTAILEDVAALAGVLAPHGGDEARLTIEGGFAKIALEDGRSGGDGALRWLDDLNATLAERVDVDSDLRCTLTARPVRPSSTGSGRIAELREGLEAKVAALAAA